MKYPKCKQQREMVGLKRVLFTPNRKRKEKKIYV